MEQTRDILHHVLSDILEKMAFLFAEDVDEKPEYPQTGAVWHASIEFYGPVKGRIEVSADENLCLTLAANALGIEPDMLENFAQKDALGEFLNIVCGDFIEKRHGAYQVYRLTIPALTECEPECWDKLASLPETVALLVEDQPMLARVEIIGD